MRAGETIAGKYVLDQLLGKGGMGAVWSAYDNQTHQKIAVKVILPQNDDAQTKELRARLRREAGACAKLQHPNIIQVHEVGETNEGDTFMVLELLDGQPLSDLLKQKRRIEAKVAARIAADIASGLSEAHAAKVVHRDLKPANIFLHRELGMAEDEFVTKVLDFGVCVDRGAIDSIQTQTGIIVGSPAYMSPEQIAMRKDIDGRADIWALGLILYEMVTGMRVFTGDVRMVLGQIATQPVPAPSSKVRDVPPDLDSVVARCTQVKREHRYAEAGELARDLYIIAGAKPTPRKPSISRPSVAKEIGLSEMYREEIQATPAVPSPGSAPTFNPMGVTLPLISPARREEAAKMPAVMEEDEDLAATLPLQPKLLAAARPKVLDEEPAKGAMGTQFLRVGAPVPSPDPVWKREMEQALEVHRQSSMSLPLIDLEKAPEIVAGTQMLPAQLAPVRQDAPMRDPSATTTSSMSQEIRAPVKSVMDPASVTGRRRRQSQLFAGVAAFFVASVALLVAVMVYRQVVLAKPETEPVWPPPNPSSSAPVIVPSVKPADSANISGPTALASSASAMPSAVGPAPEKSSSAPAATNAPKVTTADSGAPKTSVPVLKPGTSTKTSKQQMKEVCTGVGLFQRCKKVPVQ